MRILHVAPYSPDAWAYGGIPRVVAGLTSGLARRGHEVTLVATDACSRTDRLVPSAPEREHASRFDPHADGIDLRVFRNLSNRLAYGAQLFLPLGLRAFLRRNATRFDVAHLHAHRNLPVAYAAAALGRAGVPHVFTPNGTVPRIESRRRLKAIWDLVLGQAPLERAARVLAVTEAERRELDALGVARGRIELVPNPLDLTELEPPPEPGAFRRRHGLDGARVILYLGRISPRKRLDLLARAVATLPGDDLRLVVAGEEMGASGLLRDAVRGAGIEARTRVVGLQRGRERLEALADADAVAYATEDEIFGLVPLEAILCGTPVVVAGDSGCGELIRGVGGGIVVEAGEAGALSAALADLLARRDFWRREVASAAGRVRERYSSDVVAARLEAIYEEVVAERARRPAAQLAAGSGASTS